MTRDSSIDIQLTRLPHPKLPPSKSIERPSRHPRTHFSAHASLIHAPMHPPIIITGLSARMSRRSTCPQKDATSATACDTLLQTEWSADRPPRGTSLTERDAVISNRSRPTPPRQCGIVLNTSHSKTLSVSLHLAPHLGAKGKVSCLENLVLPSLYRVSIFPRVLFSAFERSCFSCLTHCAVPEPALFPMLCSMVWCKAVGTAC